MTLRRIIYLHINEFECLIMFLMFEVFYKKDNDVVVLNSIVVIKYGFRLLYFFPMIVMLLSLKRGFIVSMCFSFLVFFLGFFSDIFFLFFLLLSFMKISPDLERFDLMNNGYISAGIFFVDNKNTALSCFFGLDNLSKK